MVDDEDGSMSAHRAMVWRQANQDRAALEKTYEAMYDGVQVSAP